MAFEFYSSMFELVNMKIARRCKSFAAGFAFEVLDLQMKSKSKKFYEIFWSKRRLTDPSLHFNMFFHVRLEKKHFSTMLTRKFVFPVELHMTTELALYPECFTTYFTHCIFCVCMNVSMLSTIEKY